MYPHGRQDRTHGSVAYALEVRMFGASEIKVEIGIEYMYSRTFSCKSLRYILSSTQQVLSSHFDLSAMINPLL